MSHHVNSTIVCRISGEVMDSQNEPLAFPNGHVYSSKVSSPAHPPHSLIVPAGPRGHGKDKLWLCDVSPNEADQPVHEVEKGVHLIRICTSGRCISIHNTHCMPFADIVTLVLQLGRAS